MATDFEREIEELLKSLGEIGPKETTAQRLRRNFIRRWYGFRAWLADLPRAVPADQLMLAAILFIVAAYFLRFVLPTVARFVGIAGLLMFCAAFVLSFNVLIRRSRPTPRWRGQPVDLNRHQATLLDRIILWARRKLRGF